ncbi:LysR family transcriptional regulator [Amycolatopsis sp. H20-H5]|uniref:LysR family transcriptional regulator n=1 Tax=Amycolatopsis sp. H20-H5 TaxID=3046309 RepID=UPI002DBC46D2|nr:LysR family transcriptional regulator [Amycolatopsis sp. H20-H5]MEC3982033.1 LysR family transcriptional regulator [Amycolatopsis sp. H20-H5]
MELRHLRAFRAVARTSSFTRAAAELHYAQSSITEQVQALETELGVALFSRIGRKLALTPAGERLVGYADNVLALVEEARNVVEDSAEQPSGELTVGGLETLCATIVPGALSRYRSKFPQVKVAVRQENRGQLYASVRREDIDVCLTFGTPPASAELRSETLFSERLVVIVPRGHRLSERSPVELSDLRGEEFLVTEPGCGFREMYDRSLGKLGADGPRIAAEVGSIAALSSCVAAGMGCGLLPELAVAARHRGTEFTVLYPAETAESGSYRATVTMTWQRRWEEKPSVAAFLRIARETMTQGQNT